VSAAAAAAAAAVAAAADFSVSNPRTPYWKLFARRERRFKPAERLVCRAVCAETRFPRRVPVDAPAAARANSQT